MQDNDDGQGAGLVAPNFSSLARIDGGILVKQNRELTDAGLGHVSPTGIATSVVFVTNPKLETLEVPVRRVRSDVEIVGHGPSLKSIVLTAQSVGGHVQFIQNAGLTSIDVQVEHGFTHEIISASNPALTTLAAPNVPCEQVLQSDPELSSPALTCADR